MKIAFLEIAPAFSNQVKLPYSTSVIWSYCQTNSYIQQNFEVDIDDWIYIHEPVDVIFEKIKDCDIIGVSNFIWNQSINNQVCKKLKEYNKSVLIIYGGLGTPNDADNFLSQHDFIDVVVNGEGEYAFKEILLNYPNVKKIYKSERVSNIDEMPSPYLNGLFDQIVKHKSHSYNFEALIEPTRGCPYTCTFCEIGDTYFTKIKKQSTNKIFKELEWISNQKIDYMHIIDNNFGMLPLHDTITDHLIHLNSTNGYPNALNLTWAKNKKPILFSIAKKLQEAGLQKGVTIALQSMNNKTLEAIERSNSDNTNLKTLFKIFQKEKIPTYIELIMGLPLESAEEFKDNVYYLIDDLNYKNYIGMYVLSALPNTKFNDKHYIKEHKIKCVDTCPVFYHHTNPTDILQQETEKVVVETSVMKYNECIDLYVWRWFIITCHFLGWFRVFSSHLKQRYNISHKEFYTCLFEYITNNKSFIHYEYLITKELIKAVLKQKYPWGRGIEDVSSMYWEYEEATSIEIAKNKDAFYSIVDDFMYEYFTWDYNKNIRYDDILEVQINSMKDPYQHYNGNIEKWAVECLWWGRRNESFFNK